MAFATLYASITIPIPCEEIKNEKNYVYILHGFGTFDGGKRISGSD